MQRGRGARGERRLEPATHSGKAMQKMITFKLAAPKAQKKMTDKSDRHTTSLVLDTRTRLNIHKLQEKGKLGDFQRLINSGKEASVYHCGDVALKVFATSSMIFKNRQIYIDGDRRFKQMNTSNSRQLVRLWCEKEFRNMKRVEESALIRVPAARFTSDTVLAMELMRDSVRLVDLGKYMSVSRLEKIYYSLVRVMRDLFQKCALVHGDLSEYNVLCQNGGKTMTLIDFGQALDLTNPNALTLLRIDIRNVNTFFARMGINIVPNMRLLEFITTPLASLDESLNKLTLASPDLQPLDKIADCFSPDGHTVPQEMAAAIRVLHGEAIHMSPEDIQDDDQFVQSKVFDFIRNISEDDAFRADFKRVGIEVELEKTRKTKEKITRERLLILELKRQALQDELQCMGEEKDSDNELLQDEEGEEGVEDAEDVEESDDGTRKIDLNQLNRSDFTREEWKEVQNKLRVQKREARQNDKKPKKQKRKEQKLSRRKHGGK